MSLVSFMLIIYVTHIYTTRNEKDIRIELVFLLLLFSVFTNIGYFINIGGLSIQFDELITILISLFMLKDFFSGLKMNKNGVFIGLCLIFSIFIGQVLIHLFPYKELVLIPGNSPGLGYGLGSGYDYPSMSIFSVRYFIRIFLMVWIMLWMTSIFNKSDLINIFLKIMKFGKFHFIIIFLEFMGKNILRINFVGSIIQALFNIGSMHTVVRGGLVTLNGLMYEPAQFAEGLWIFGLILIYLSISNREKTRLLIINIIFLILSGSLKGLFFSVALILIYLINTNGNMKYIITFSLLFFTILLINLNPSNERVSNIINTIMNYDRNLIEYNSENLRMMTVIEAFKVFIDRPILGIGLGNTYAFGALPTILSNIGFIGLTLWLFLIKKITAIKVNLNLISITLIIALVYTANGSIALMYNTALFSLLYMISLNGRGKLNEKI